MRDYKPSFVKVNMRAYGTNVGMADHAFSTYSAALYGVVWELASHIVFISLSAIAVADTYMYCFTWRLLCLPIRPSLEKLKTMFS